MLSKIRFLPLLAILAIFVILSDMPLVYCQTTVDVDFNPETLNLKSRGQYVTVAINFSGTGYTANNITKGSITLVIKNSTGDTSPDLKPVRPAQVENGLLILKFSRSSVQDAVKKLGGAGEYTAIVSGTFSNGTAFTGEDTFRAISPGRGPKSPKSPKSPKPPKPPK